MRWLAALLLIVLAGPAIAATGPVASVAVERNGERWTADYHFSEASPLWVFAKSQLPRESKTSWRLATVRVLTSGVQLQRLGNFDTLVGVNGPVPKHVRLSFTPSVADLDGGYTPALALADGSVALYADQFTVIPVQSATVVERALPQADALPRADERTRMTFLDPAGPVLIHGKREKQPTVDDGQAYVLFGRARPVIGPAMTTILDPALPTWIGEYLNGELPRILSQYQEKLGPSPVGQPTLLVSWAGPLPKQISLSGSVLPGMVVMTLAGDVLLKPNGKVSHYTRWFVAHEAAHFWLGQAVHYSDRSESWITEGGAELLAFRATAAADPTFDVKARLSEAKAECLPFLAHGGIASAYQREGDFRAYYACGAIIALAAEKASGGDFGRFVRTLIARDGADETVTRAEWLALLDEQAGRKLSPEVAKLLDRPQHDPAAAMQAFVDRTGIADAFATDRASK